MAGSGPAVYPPQSPTTSWFASMFGQCCKGPPVEGELKFDEPDRKEKKSKKKNTERESARGAGAGAQAASTSRYIVDNSILKIENRPGVAYRYSKKESDKVRAEPGPAKWGAIVEGIDEGDGWLKVGKFYLPMKYNGIPVVTLVTDEAQQKTKALGVPPASLSNQPQQRTAATQDNAFSRSGTGSPAAPVAGPLASTPAATSPAPAASPAAPAARATPSSSLEQAAEQAATATTAEDFVFSDAPAAPEKQQSLVMKQKAVSESPGKAVGSRNEQQKHSRSNDVADAAQVASCLEKDVEGKEKVCEAESSFAGASFTSPQKSADASCESPGKAEEEARPESSIESPKKVPVEASEKTLSLLCVKHLARVKATGLAGRITKTNGHAFKLAGKWYLGEDLEPQEEHTLCVKSYAMVKATGIAGRITKTNGHAFKLAGKWYLGEELQSQEAERTLCVRGSAVVKATGTTGIITNTNGHAFKLAGKWYLAEELEPLAGC